MDKAAMMKGLMQREHPSPDAPEDELIAYGHALFERWMMFRINELVGGGLIADGDRAEYRAILLLRRHLDKDRLKQQGESRLDELDRRVAALERGVVGLP